ncbi:MAG: SIS domain-containing protein [Oscillospiraceae bacterium]
MYLAEQELRNQFEALGKSVNCICEKENEIKTFFKDTKSLCVLGCGSSYSVAKSSALQFSQKTGVAAYAIAAGDLCVNFESYGKIIDGSTLLVLSRSGSTSELVMAAKKCQEKFNVKIVSICAVQGSDIGKIADLSFAIPWAFDESICQTRTVSNLYIGALLLTAIVSKDKELVSDIFRIEEKANAFCEKVENTIEDIGLFDFQNAVVLADSGMAGIAEEGSLAFKEICRINSNFYNVLDVRHGPIVKITDNTLVLVLISSGNEKLQRELVSDLCSKSDKVVAFECKKTQVSFSCPKTITLPDCVDDNLSALFMLYCIQLITFKHAINLNVNPDKPEGLDAWIKL